MVPEKTPTLPTFITGYIDLSRLIREAENIEDSLHQLKLRKPGTQVKLPKTSFLMDQLINYYKLNMLHQTDRTNLINYLNRIKTEAPSIHFSFSADPSPQFLNSLTTWLRDNIHPELLVTVGLQPTIGAGCIVRTTNQYFDFSLAQTMKNSRGMLLDKIAQSTDQTVQNQVLAQEPVR